ncbi:protein of unknown function (plasmid) [Candidatus Promineifilum breve]|jgi:hypothetical protein|uniref:Uncharacterized protein n=1 Tax=Candidatus Promineifilum breve TaxID=1806508 RepID=A0A161KB79_9CHLR|nr:hypothetical protein [Candidatus Promineifilum breve]CUS05383.2 protein of unknown function [Candidatus Promineifilum breve]CUS06460.1 protein of unknown function [Candidatus Promineifilum breve]
MKNGKTILRENTNGFPPTVEVGGDDRAVHVSFGTIVISLSMAGAYTIVATARARDQNDRALPMTARLATDARATVEFNLPLEAPAA